MTGLKALDKLSTFNPDALLVSRHGEIPIHSVLLAVHSSLIREILDTIPDQSELCFIIPDFGLCEIQTLRGLMYGIIKSGQISEIILKTLGFFDLDKARITHLDGVIIIFDGNLEGFHLVEPSVYQQSSSKMSSTEEPAVDTNLAVMASAEVPVEVTNHEVVSDLSVQHIDLGFGTSEGSAQGLTSEVSLEGPPDLNIVTSVEVVTTEEALLTSTHPGNTVETKDVHYVCSICNKQFKGKRYLKNHVILKHSGDPAISAKARKVSQEKSYNRECGVCHQLFNSRNILHHIKSSHPEEDLSEQCEICDKKFANLWTLKRHNEDVHQVRRKYNCVHCDFIAKRKSHLEDHMKLHSDESFSCEKCGYTTARKRELGGHKCREKGFTCDLCGKGSVSQEALWKHIQVSFCNISLINFYTLIFFCILTVIVVLQNV